MNKLSHSAAIARLIQSFDLLEAVRAQGSFAGAARELGVDPSAVSHRVHALETEIGLTLFERTTRSISPTRAGMILCEAAARSWTDAERALSSARDVQSARVIRLSVHSSLAMKWLVPRLNDAESVGLDLSIDVREELATFRGGEVDAGLRFGTGPYPGLHATRLASCDIQPVIGAAHPAAGKASLDPVSDASLVLLADSGAEKYETGTTWKDYFQLLNRPAELRHPVRHFDRADLTLQAAIGGLGMALGRSLLIEDDIQRGLLVRTGLPMRVKSAYWLVTTPELAESEGMRILRSWLMQQVRVTLTRG